MINLKIGQVVNINSSIDKKQNSLYSSGFTNKNVFIRSTKQLQQSQQSRSSLFVVLPTGNFQMHDEILKKHNQRDQIRAYQTRLDTEKNLFEVNIESHKDSVVTFGQDIIFKHIDSQSYLSGCFQCSEGGTGGFKIILTQNLSSQIIFRVQSYQSFLKEGDNIFLKSPIYIFNPKTKCYLATQGNSVITFSQRSCVWMFEPASQLPLVYLQHTRINGYLYYNCVIQQLQILEPKQNYCIYEPIWVFREKQKTLKRLGKTLNVSNRIGNYVDISIDVGSLLAENQQYRTWKIQYQSSLQDCFEMIPLDKITHRQILFISSTLTTLFYFSKDLQKNLNYKQMVYIKGLLNQIKNFLLNKNQADHQENQELSVVVAKRQYLMRDLGSIEQLLHLIKKMYPFIKNKHLSGKKMEEEQGNTIFSKLYQCLEICCFENQRIKTYIAPHLLQIFTHCSTTHIENVIPKIICSIPPTIDLEKFDSLDPLYLSFLGVLSKNTANHPQLYKKIKIRWTITDWIDINGLRWRYSDQPADYTCFTEWIQMCSKLCVNRNLRAQTIIQSRFNLKNLLLLIKHPYTEGKPLLKRFVSLLHYCYVDTIYFNPVILDRLCEYDKLTIDSLEKGMNSGYVAEQTTKFLKQYLQKYNFKPKNIQENQNLLEVLSLLNRTIVLGFWPSTDNLTNIIKKLTDILKNNDPELIQTSKKQNLLTIKVKHFILKIVNTVIDFQLAARVKLLTLKFKQIYYQNNKVEYKDWLKAIEQTILQKNLLGNTSMQIDFCYTLIQLSQYPNVELLSSNLSIIKRIFSQKEEIIQSFQKIYLLNTKVELTGYTIDQIKQIRQKLFILNEPTLKFATLNNQSEYGTLIWSPNEQNKGLIHHIWEMAQWMKSSNCCEKLDYQKIGENQIHEFFNERQLNIKKHQQILKSLEIHKLLIRFIVNLEEIPQGQIARKLLYVIYYFLTILVWNSLQCKNELTSYVQIIKKQLFYRVGAIDLLRQLFDNNPGFIYNQKEFQEITVMILDRISKQQERDYYTSKLLDLFRCTLYYNEKTVAQNQVFLLSKLQEYDSLIVFSVEDVQLKELIKQYEKSYKLSFETLVLNINPRLLFIITLFNLFGILIEDQNKINLGKCTQIHPFRELLKFSSFSKRCWSLKRNVRSYLNKLYYMHDNYNGIMELIKLQEFDNMLYDLNEFIYLQNSDYKIDQIRLKNPIRFAYFYTYVYLNFEEILISLYFIMENTKMNEYLRKQLRKSFEAGNFQLHLKFLRIIERLSYLKLTFYYESKYLRTIINFIIVHIEKVLIEQPKELQLIFLSKIENPNRNFVSAKLILDVCKRGNILRFYQIQRESMSQIFQNFPLSFYEADAIFHRKASGVLSPKMSMHQKVEISPTLMKIFKGLFSKKNQDRRLVSFHQLVKKFNQNMKTEYNIKQSLDITFKIQSDCPVGCKGECNKCVWFFFSSEDQKQKKGMSFVDYVKVLLRQNCRNPNFFQTNLKIFFFKMIEILIYSKCDQKAEIRKQSGPKYWGDEKEEVLNDDLSKIQVLLKDYGTHQVICSTIKNCVLQSELELANQLFKLSIAFLEEGNTECQNALLNQMKSDEHNMVMRKLNELIIYVNKKIIDYFKIVKVETVVNDKFGICTNDTYDYFDMKQNRMIRKNVYEPDTDKQIKEKNLIIAIFCNLFDFLHLLCENNNVDAKKFIKFQGNPRNSVNLLQTAVVSLRKMLKIMNPKIIDMPTRLLSFINETTQLPCIQNQTFISKTTLFEDISTMEQTFSGMFLTIYSEPEKYRQDLEFLIKIQQIYEQFINILVSISEGNCDPIYNEFNKIQPIFFIRVVFNYLKSIGISIKNPVDIFHMVQSKEQKQFQLKIKSRDAQVDKVITKILNIEILAKKIENRDPDQTSDFIKMFKLPFFKHLPKLIQIQIENQQQFFCPSGEISQQSKDMLILKAKRDTQRQKIIYLLQKQDQVFNEIQFKKSDNIEVYKLISQVIALIINVIICFRDIIFEDEEVDIIFTDVRTFHILKIVHFILGLIYVVKYIHNEKPFLFAKYKKIEKKQIPKNRILQVFLLLKLVYRSSKFSQLVFILVFSVIAYYKPPLYSIHVFAMFTRIQSLQSVFQAIQTNIEQLTLVGVFGVVFFYIFSLISLDIYSTTLYTSKDEDICSNWVDCIMDLYISGTINSSIVDFIPSRFLFDLVYFIFFGLLFGNIISGLMTDTFKELRSMRDEIQSNQNNYCYICGINRETLERNGEILNDSYRTAANKNLIVHQERHNRFNYLYYIYMLRTKQQTDFTGLEYEIMNKIKSEDISWIPSFERSNSKSEQQKIDVKLKTNQILDLIQRVKQKKREMA